MQRLRIHGQLLRGFDQRRCGLLLALGVNDFRAPGAFGLGLLGNRADHALVEIDMFDLDIRYLDAPGIGALVEYPLDIGIEPVTLRQHLVEFVLTQHRAQRRLRQLAGRLEKIFHLDYRFFRIDHAEIDDGVDLDRYVVTRNHILGRDIHYDYSQIDLCHRLQYRDDQDQSGALYLVKAAELEDHSAFVFLEDLDRAEQHAKNKHNSNNAKIEHSDLALFVVSLDDQCQTIHIKHSYFLPGLQRCCGPGVPKLAVHPH